MAVRRLCLFIVLFTSRGSRDHEWQVLCKHNMEIWDIRTPYYFFLKITFTRANKAYSMKERFYFHKFCKLPFILRVFKAWILKIGEKKIKYTWEMRTHITKGQYIKFFWMAVCSIIVKESWHFFLKLLLLLWMGYSIRRICLLWSYNFCVPKLLYVSRSWWCVIWSTVTFEVVPGCTTATWFSFRFWH